MITLNQVIPHPVKEQEKHHLSQVWNTDVKFEQGLKYLIAAPSGRGKSSLLAIIYGLRMDYDGNVHWYGDNIKTFTRNQWADIRQKHISMLFQDMHLFPELTAWENLSIKSTLANKPTDTLPQDMAEQLGIAHLLKKKTRFLSYGERQRLALIRCLLQPFEFLLLDEPFSNLDDDNSIIAAKLIKIEADKRGASIIVADLGHSYDFEYDVVLDL
jgi:ABC-type lipoprotein export system ATPase subunit